MLTDAEKDPPCKPRAHSMEPYLVLVAFFFLLPSLPQNWQLFKLVSALKRHDCFPGHPGLLRGVPQGFDVVFAVWSPVGRCRKGPEGISALLAMGQRCWEHSTDSDICPLNQHWLNCPCSCVTAVPGEGAPASVLQAPWLAPCTQQRGLL